MQVDAQKTKRMYTPHFEISQTKFVFFSELLWYNLCPTLSTDQIKSLAQNYNPTNVNPFAGVTVDQIAKITKIDMAQCKQILKLLVSFEQI